jgi:hypothetical protein
MESINNTIALSFSMVYCDLDCIIREKIKNPGFIMEKTKYKKIYNTIYEQQLLHIKDQLRSNHG